jgi:hypothetical protein
MFIFFPLWMGFEWVRRALFSRGIPCPHCGFDASWYKRDVKVARRLVSDFWSDQEAPEEEFLGGEVPLALDETSQNQEYIDQI